MGDTMLSLFCWILAPRSTLSIIPCSSTDFTQNVWIVLSWIGSPLICLVDPNKFFGDILRQRRLLLSVVSPRDKRSVPSSFLSTPDIWRNSFKSSALITTFLLMILSSTHAYWQNVSLPWEQKGMLNLVMRLRVGWWKTNWSLMSRKLRYFSADRLPGGRVSLLTAFW